MDDDFGDFGDFGEGAQAEDGATFELETFDTEPALTPRPAEDWQALNLDPLPSREKLQRQLDSILGPLWTADDPSLFIEDEIRQAEGLNQTLVTPERYFFTRPAHDLYLKSQIVPVVNCMMSCSRQRTQPSNP